MKDDDEVVAGGAAGAGLELPHMDEEDTDALAPPLPLYRVDCITGGNAVKDEFTAKVEPGGAPPNDDGIMGVGDEDSPPPPPLLLISVCSRLFTGMITVKSDNNTAAWDAALKKVAFSKADAPTLAGPLIREPGREVDVVKEELFRGEASFPALPRWDGNDAGDDDSCSMSN